MSCYMTTRSPLQSSRELSLYSCPPRHKSSFPDNNIFECHTTERCPIVFRLEPSVHSSIRTIYNLWTSYMSNSSQPRPNPVLILVFMSVGKLTSEHQASGYISHNYHVLLDWVVQMKIFGQFEIVWVVWKITWQMWNMVEDWSKVSSSFCLPKMWSKISALLVGTFWRYRWGRKGNAFKDWTCEKIKNLCLPNRWWRIGALASIRPPHPHWSVLTNTISEVEIHQYRFLKLYRFNHQTSKFHFWSAAYWRFFNIWEFSKKTVPTFVVSATKQVDDPQELSNPDRFGSSSSKLDTRL